jgi:hypothetical protein
MRASDSPFVRCQERLAVQIILGERASRAARRQRLGVVVEYLVDIEARFAHRIHMVARERLKTAIRRGGVKDIEPAFSPGL